MLPPAPVAVQAENPKTARRVAAVAARKKKQTQTSPEKEQPFIAIPYTAPLSPYERTDIVRMDLPVSALIAAGIPLKVSDQGARARADLVVSEDGRARAVRLISISNSDSDRRFQ